MLFFRMAASPRGCFVGADFVDTFLIRAGKIPRPAYSQLGVSSQDGDFLFMAASPRGSFVGADFCGCVFDTSGKFIEKNAHHHFV